MIASILLCASTGMENGGPQLSMDNVVFHGNGLKTGFPGASQFVNLRPVVVALTYSSQSLCLASMGLVRVQEIRALLRCYPHMDTTLEPYLKGASAVHVHRPIAMSSSSGLGERPQDGSAWGLGRRVRTWMCFGPGTGIEERHPNSTRWRRFLSLWRRVSSSVRSRPNADEGESQQDSTTLLRTILVGPLQPPLEGEAHERLQISHRLLDRFRQLGDLHDLQQATTILQELVQSTSVSDGLHRAALGKLGVALLCQFRHSGNLGDLENGISTHKRAVQLTPLDHPDRPKYLNNLGTSLSTRFKRLGKPSDMEEAISALKDAISLTPDGHPDRPGYLGTLGFLFFTRFTRFGEPGDLEEAISLQRKAADLIPDDHPEKPDFLSELGISLQVRFQHFAEPSDLDESISVLTNVINIISHDRFDRPGYLSNLGTSFFTRFEHFGELRDLDRAISALRDAIDLIPPDDPVKLGCLCNLGLFLAACFEHLKELSDLEDAILKQKNVVDLIPPDHPDKAIHLNNLGSSLISRFQYFGELGDIDNAISLLNDAVILTPDDHPVKAIYLNDLGSAFFSRFRCAGGLSDLENAISRQRDACNDTHSSKRSSYLINLGISLFTRFQHLEELSDLEDAIVLLIDAANLTPRDHPDRIACLNSLGACLNARFHSLGDQNDLEDTISMLREVLDLARPDNPRKPDCLDRLGHAFFIRFHHFGKCSDLDDAISMAKDAVYIVPYDHPLRANYLNNLGNLFFARFKCLGELNDLETAISTLVTTIDLTAHSHPNRPACLCNLGASLTMRFEFQGDPSDLEDAISLYAHAASSPIGPIDIRFYAAQKWISLALPIHHRSLLHAYSMAIDLLPQLAWIGLSITSRYAHLVRDAGVVREAAAAALEASLPETAVEWLEQGRSVLWGELFQLRSSYDQLSSAHPDHACRLLALSAELERASAARESLSASRDVEAYARDLSQQEADRHRALAIQRDELLREIRRLPNFEGFLHRRQFSQLRDSAHAGPVVILNAAQNRCDALIVLADVDHAIHVPLPKFTLERSTGLQNMLKGFVRSEREGKGEKWDDVNWESCLSPLWQCVVKPILAGLAFSIPGELTHIFWCPAGPFAFLPIHAAGFYDDTYAQPGHKVFDFVISSYVPTLSILALSTATTVDPRDSLRLLIVRQPGSDGQSPLPGVLTESEYIKDVLRRSPSARAVLVESCLGSVEEVLGLMKDADWAHFACHGVQDGVDSGLCLADRRRLKLRDIIAVSRPRGGLAFLSACQTAKGEERLSDEAIHLAAGMLFAGYGGVVGTMWSISDSLAPVVAREVYEHLFRNGTRPDYREGARALHEAIAYVRENEAVSFDEWVPFIHVGL